MIIYLFSVFFQLTPHVFPIIRDRTRCHFYESHSYFHICFLSSHLLRFSIVLSLETVQLLLARPLNPITILIGSQQPTMGRSESGADGATEGQSDEDNGTKDPLCAL